MEPLTDSRTAARTTHLLTACPGVTIIASRSDGGVAPVFIPILCMRRDRGDAGNKAGAVRSIPSAHVPSGATPFLREAPTPDARLTPSEMEGIPLFHPLSVCRSS